MATVRANVMPVIRQRLLAKEADGAAAPGTGRGDLLSLYIRHARTRYDDEPERRAAMLSEECVRSHPPHVHPFNLPP